MRIDRVRALVTGASGGLGAAIVRELKANGAAVLAAGRDASKLAALGADATVAADVTTAEGVETLAKAARDFRANALVNNAGIGAFGLFDGTDWTDLAQVLETNLAAPMRLTHALLPALKAEPEAAILNVGSTFGSVPFAGFAAYSAAKAGLRGFSQALRRELADTRVAVIHLAPRAIDTPLNGEAVRALNRALGNAADTPEAVARTAVAALARGSAERHFGFPERLFAWINGAAPALVDRGVAGKLSVIKRHAPARVS